MPNPSPGVIRRSFGAAWRALDFTRRLVFNLLFLAIAIAVLAALVSSRPAIAPRTTLVLDPEGAVVEQFSSDPAQRALSALAGDASAGADAGVGHVGLRRRSGSW